MLVLSSNERNMAGGRTPNKKGSLISTNRVRKRAGIPALAPQTPWIGNLQKSAGRLIGPTKVSKGNALNGSTKRKSTVGRRKGAAFVADGVGVRLRSAL